MEVNIKLPRPYPKQQEVLDNTSRFKVLCVGRRSGKTTLCIIKTITSMLNTKRVCYITPEFRLADKLFDDITLKIPEVLIKKKNKSRLHLELVTGGSLSFFSGEALNRSRGYEFDLLIVDESAYIDDLKTEWDMSLRPLLMKTKGEAIFVSTPKGKNYFYSLFQKGLMKEDGFHSWQFSSHSNPYIPKEELEELRMTLPEAAYSQEILAEPGENMSNPFGTNNIERCRVSSLSNKPTVCYGIDFGRVNDYTVITGQDEDGKLSYFDRFKLSWESTIVIVNKLRAMDPYTLIVVDSTGVGSVLLERLQATIYNITGFEFTGKSKPIIIHNLIKDIETCAITINDIIAQEMSTFEFKYTSGGHLSYNAQSGFHDDSIASLAMCNYYRRNNSMRDTLVIF